MKNSILYLVVIFLLASCTVTKQTNTDKTNIKTDSSNVTDITEKIDTTVKIKADTSNYNNLPVTIFTDTADTTPVVLENTTTKVIIKKKKTGKVDITVIKKEQEVKVQFERHTRSETHLKKAIRMVNKETNTQTRYGHALIIIPVILLLLLILLYYLYRRWKKGLLKFP